MIVAADVLEMVQACLTRFKRIDVLVNNVGGSAPGDPVSMTEEVWDRQISFNLKTAFLGCKYVLPVMVEQGRGQLSTWRRLPACGTISPAGGRMSATAPPRRA
jgi:NAD(P)-dependent dehydrogenase (short-subunit alcohol dehydrogenase family)